MTIKGNATDGESAPECEFARAGALQFKKASSTDIAGFPLNINGAKGEVRKRPGLHATLRSRARGPCSYRLR